MALELPSRLMTTDEVEAYRRDGVTCIRGLYSQEWVAKISAALDTAWERLAGFDIPNVTKNFRGDAFTWLFDDSIRDFVLYGPTARLAQQAFGSQRVNFFYDQLFLKKALTPDPTPWHHDAPFWPLSGGQIASVWTSVDAVDAESSALEFIAGSHLWKKRWKPIGPGGAVMSRESLEALPDIDADRSEYNILSWALEPGDALLFHSQTIHGARGNSSPHKGRRALTTRWCDEGVVYQPKDGQMQLSWKHGLEPGDHLSGAIFPQILPELDVEALSQRLQGPIYPDPELAARAYQQIITAERVPVRM